MTENKEAEVVAHLRAVAATPPGEQSLWDCTIAARAADLIAYQAARIVKLEKALEPFAAWYEAEQSDRFNGNVGEMQLRDRSSVKLAALTPEHFRAALTTSKDIPLTLRPFHIELLKRGTDGRDIWVHDRAELFGAEMAALAEMKRAGLVKQSPKSNIPGPPDVPAYVLTDAGRAALTALAPHQSAT